MDGQDRLREKVKEYVNRHGSTHKWFYTQLGISSAHFSYWLKGERILGDERAAKLNEILTV